MRSRKDDGLRCSFCHKAEDVVAKLISSPSDYPRVYICDECIMVCNSIMNEPKESQPESPESEEDQLRSHLALLLEYIPDTELRTVQKILNALAVYGSKHPAGPAEVFSL